MKSKPLLGEYVSILGKQEIKVYCNNSHSKLPNLLKVIRLTLFFILWSCLWNCILVILRISNGCLLPIHGIRRRVVLRYRGYLCLRIWHVDNSSLIIAILRVTAAMMLIAFILLGHHHILHIHHILVLQFNKRPHHIILILLSRCQVSFKP